MNLLTDCYPSYDRRFKFDQCRSTWRYHWECDNLIVVYDEIQQRWSTWRCGANRLYDVVWCQLYVWVKFQQLDLCNITSLNTCASASVSDMYLYTTFQRSLVNTWYICIQRSCVYEYIVITVGRRCFLYVSSFTISIPCTNIIQFGD